MEDEQKILSKKIKSNDDYLKFKEKNKDKIKAKIFCDICGGHYVYYSKSLHLKSKKHLFCIKKYIE